MGTGKSTVGPILAESLGRRFIDLDQAIEERWGCSISQMFAEVGEGEFRRRESELLKRPVKGILSDCLRRRSCAQRCKPPGSKGNL